MVSEMFNSIEKAWLEKCTQQPDKYKVEVDNDAIFVTDIEENDCVFSFDDFGYHFALNLLKHIGCNADYV